MALHELEGYDEVVQRFLELLAPEERLAGLTLEQRLAGLTLEQRLAGLTLEQRLAGLTPEQAVLAAPDEVLRALSSEFLEKLPETIRAAVRQRIGR